ncbi:MAG: (2Fe-2S)-binding protein [Gammaproteobacteria bacterium]
MYVCVCNAVTESQIRQAVAEGVASLAALKTRLGVAANCGSCEEQAVRVIQQSLLGITVGSKTPVKPAFPRHNAA